MLGGVTIHILIMLAAYRTIRSTAFEKGHSESAPRIGWLGPAGWAAGALVAAVAFGVLGFTFATEVVIGEINILTLHLERLGGGALGLTAALLWAQRGLRDKWAAAAPANP